MFGQASIPQASETHRTGSFLSRLPGALLEMPLRLIRPIRERRAQMVRQYEAARLALGERMYAAGIDDGETGAQIAAVDQQVLATRLAGTSWEALEAERERLFLRLADAALENDAPLPGADAEFQHAWDLKLAVGAGRVAVS